jgi:ACS family tartrate transporter-like MFS transporter
MDSLERRAIAKISLRLVPFLIVCYLAAYLDRVNVGFAALTMNKALGLDAAAFGLGAGIFFIAYFVFEVPSNLFLERFGARKWIARIMLTWGLLSGLMAFIPQIAAATGSSTTFVFYTIRVLLGAAEAGFFPGIIFYLTLWFPATYRARIIGYFMAAIPLSTVIGAPISGMLLNLDGAVGLAGWQWLFILEAVPALVLSVAVFCYLTDRPEDAHWLAADERGWLTDRLATERRQREAAKTFGVWEALGDTRVLLLAFVYFGVVAANYGLSFFLPQIVRDFGLSFTATGFVTALPYVIGTAGMVWWGRRSDRMRERKEHVGLAALVAGGGIAASTLIADPTGKMIALSIAGFGIFAVLPVFWTLPTTFLSGAAAAGGIAIINALGNLAGFVGPYVMGTIKDSTGSFTIGLLVIAGLAILAMLVALSLPHDAELETLPDR